MAMGKWGIGEALSQEMLTLGGEFLNLKGNFVFLYIKTHNKLGNIAQLPGKYYVFFLFCFVLFCFVFLPWQWQPSLLTLYYWMSSTHDRPNFQFFFSKIFKIFIAIFGFSINNTLHTNMPTISTVVLEKAPWILKKSCKFQLFLTQVCS